MKKMENARILAVLGTVASLGWSTGTAASVPDTTPISSQPQIGNSSGTVTGQTATDPTRPMFGGPIGGSQGK